MPIFEERTLYLAGNQCCDQVLHRFIYVRLARDDCSRLVTCARRYTHIHERACPHFRKSAVIPSTHTHTHNAHTYPEFLVGITRVKEEDERKDRRETEEKREDREREREGRRGRERRRYIAPCNEWGPSENRATDTVPETHTRDGNYPGRFSGARWLRTIDDRFYLFFHRLFFSPFSHSSLSPPPLSFPALACALMSKLLVRFVGIAFRC